MKRLENSYNLQLESYVLSYSVLRVSCFTPPTVPKVKMTGPKVAGVDRKKSPTSS